MSKAEVVFPEAFIARLSEMATIAGIEPNLSCFHRVRATAFRANPLKGGSTDLTAELQAMGFALRPVPGVVEAFCVHDEQRRKLTETAAVSEGRLYIQNPSSMIAPLVLNPQPGEEVLDLAAAPGGKTIHIAGLMKNMGRIAAVESVRARFFRLRRNLMQFGVEIADTYLKDGRQVWRVRPDHFDRVLLDAPCSGEGRFTTTNPKSFSYWSEKKIREMARKQTRLLHAAVRALKPGGFLVYCTCTFAPEENELVIASTLQKFGDTLEIEEIPLDLPSATSAFTDWRGISMDRSLSRAVRIWPDDMMEGFFVALLRKVGS